MMFDIDVLLNSGKIPRMHGNGFIQLEVGEGRLHIWPYPDLGQQAVSSQIHNHRFGFTSTVLLGNTFDLRYEVLSVQEDATHLIHVARSRDREDTILVPVNWPYVVATPSCPRYLQAGDTYTVAPLEYHEHVPTRGLVATFMVKTAVLKEFEPKVLVPFGKEPDNDFNRYQFHEADLWEVIDEVCSHIK